MLVALVPRAHAEGMTPLEGLVGSWRLVPNDPAVAATIPPGRSVVRELFDDVALEEDLEVFVPDGSSVRLRHLISWDRFRSVYRVVALDDGSGLLDVYEGEFRDGALTVTNLRSGTFFPDGEGGWTAFRLRWSAFEEDRVRFEASTSADGGETWVSYVDQHYLREEALR